MPRTGCPPRGRRRTCGAVGHVVEMGWWRSLRFVATSHFRRWSAGGDHAMEQDSTRTQADGPALFAGDAWFDPIEAGIRERVRGFIEELIGQELEATLGR